MGGWTPGASLAFGAACGLGVYVCSSDWCGLNLSSGILQELGAEGRGGGGGDGGCGGKRGWCNGS